MAASSKTKIKGGRNRVSMGIKGTGRESAKMTFQRRCREMVMQNKTNSASGDWISVGDSAPHQMVVNGYRVNNPNKKNKSKE